MALDVIKSLSENVIFIEFAGYFTNPFEVLAFLQKNKIDLIFLDIKMPNLTGIDFFKTIPNPPLVIFTTAYSEHAVQSFELDAIDYLLKPFSLPRFLKACNKAYEQYELRRNSHTSSPALPSVFIKSGYDQIRVQMDDILYVESSGNYMQFVLEKQKILSRLTMSEAEALLPLSTFIRIHRSYLVAKKHISKIEKRSVWVKGTELPLGAAYANDIEKLLQ